MMAFGPLNRSSSPFLRSLLIERTGTERLRDGFPRRLRCSTWSLLRPLHFLRPTRSYVYQFLGISASRPLLYLAWTFKSLWNDNKLSSIFQHKYYLLLIKSVGRHFLNYSVLHRAATTFRACVSRVSTKIGRPCHVDVDQADQFTFA